MLHDSFEAMSQTQEKTGDPRSGGLSYSVIKELFRLKTLEECTSYAAVVLENPVLIVDPAFGILAHSHYETGWDKGWDDLFERGEYTFEYLASNFEFDKNNISDLERGLPAVGLNAQSENRRLVVRMYSRGIFLGSFAVIEACRSFIPSDLDLAYILARIAGNIIAENRIVLRKRKYSSLYSCLIDRLEGIQNDENVFNEVLTKNGLSEDTAYHVVLVDLSNYYLQCAPPDLLRDFLKTLAPHTQSLYYERNVLVLLPVGWTKNPALLFDTLDKWLQRWNLRASVSDKFYRPFDLPEYYRQVKTAFAILKDADSEGSEFLKARKPYASLLFYEDFRFIDMASSASARFPKPDAAPMSMYDDKMIEILEYDRRFDTTYMKTLWVYLNNDKNTLNTSLEMGVHRNTTSYRLHKIEELFDVDFADQWQMFRIYTSYLTYLNIGRK